MTTFQFNPMRAAGNRAPVTNLLYLREELPLRDLAKRYQTDWGVATQAQTRDGFYAFPTQEAVFVVMTRPMTDADREDLVAQAGTFGWDATGLVTRLRFVAQVLTVPAPQTSVRQQMLLATQFLATAAGMRPVAAVAAAHVAHLAEDFRHRAQSIRQGMFPLSCVVTIQLFKEHEDSIRVGAYTAGLDQFGHKELEIPGSIRQAEDVKTFMSNVCQYIIDTGTKMGDGDQLTLSETEILTLHESAGIALPVPTLKLDY